MSTQRAYKKALEIVRSSDYVKRWFDAANFFNTFHTSDIMNGCYFITGDSWMSGDIWALRHITGDGIDTVHHCDNEADCLAVLEDLTND